LVKFEKKIAFEVLDQIVIPEDKEYKTKSGITIVAFYPYIEEIKNDLIYVRGTSRSERNNRLSVCTFNSNDERDVYYEKIITALKEFSESLSQ